jgi:hypothetical protein
VNYLLDTLRLDLADLPLERITQLDFQQRKVDYTGEWSTTATLGLTYELAPDRDAFYGVCWTFVCGAVAATESKSCRLLVTTRPVIPERTEPAQVKGEIDTAGRERFGAALSSALDSARKRTGSIHGFVLALASGLDPDDPRLHHDDPNVRVVFPLPLANIRLTNRRGAG